MVLYETIWHTGVCDAPWRGELLPRLLGVVLYKAISLICQAQSDFALGAFYSCLCCNTLFTPLWFF